MLKSALFFCEIVKFLLTFTKNQFRLLSESSWFNSVKKRNQTFIFFYNHTPREFLTNVIVLAEWQGENFAVLIQSEISFDTSHLDVTLNELLSENKADLAA